MLLGFKSIFLTLLLWPTKLLITVDFSISNKEIKVSPEQVNSFESFNFMSNMVFLCIFNLFSNLIFLLSGR